MERNNNFLSVEDLSVEYTSEGKIVHAVNHVSFSLQKGHTLGLVGETGAGKTSIAKAIMRILPDFSAKVTSGKVILDGTDILQISEKEMRKLRGKNISMIFQDPMTALNPVMRVVDQIAEVIREHHKTSAAEATAEAIRMLKKVGIAEDRAREYPHQFSGGMKQRVVIAMALACDPDLLLADEPTTALDVTIQAQVLDMINDLKQEYDTAMIMITHDLGVVAEVCDDVAVIYAGEVIEMGSKEDIFDEVAHPYTIGLFGSLPDLNVDVDRLSPIEGLPPDPTDLPHGCKFCPRCSYAEEACRENEVALTEITPGHWCRCRKPGKKEAPHGNNH
ncbi:MAG: ABC transporter ATP-binding protein [Clostridiales bacterium]|nr:ABC transporter ATP-binding protein [Clostridiales bacterium]